jgi:hypothetical protein
LIPKLKPVRAAVHNRTGQPPEYVRFTGTLTTGITTGANMVTPALGEIVS